MPLSTEYKWFKINFLKLFKQPGTVDKFSPTYSGIPYHGCHGEFHGFPGLQLVRSCPMFPVLPLNFALMDSSSYTGFSLSGPVLFWPILLSSWLSLGHPQGKGVTSPVHHSQATGYCQIYQLCVWVARQHGLQGQR